MAARTLYDTDGLNQQALNRMKQRVANKGATMLESSSKEKRSLCQRGPKFTGSYAIGLPECCPVAISRLRMNTGQFLG